MNQSSLILGQFFYGLVDIGYFIISCSAKEIVQSVPHTINHTSVLASAPAQPPSARVLALVFNSI